jgi:DHA2 family methylenomycin A resistance protein-like MFS transporter
MVGTLLVGLDRTIVNLALPDIIGDFDISVSTASWLGTGYIIADAVFIPIFGRLGDMLGDRRVYMWGMWGFLVTSVLCGLAPGFVVLLVARVVQGLVGAAVFPTSLALITRAFTDPVARARAFGIWSASFAVTIALGPLVGGPLIDNLSWRWIFFINFPIAIVGLLMVRAWVPREDRQGHLHRFDWQGALLLAAPLTAVTLVIERGSEWGWLSPGAIVCYTITVLGTAWFIAWERGMYEPMVRLGMLRDRTLSLSLLISFVAFIGMVGTMFLMPVFAQSMLGFDATGAGSILLPMSAALMVAAGLSARLSSTLSMRTMVTAGFLISAAGVLLLSGVDARTRYWELAIPLVIMGVGVAATFPALTASATASVPITEAGVASSLLNLSRNMGAAVGIAMVATLSENLFDANVMSLSDGTVIDVPSAAQSVVPLIMVKAQIEAYGAAFAAAGAVLLVAALCSLMLSRQKATEVTSGPPAH